MYSFVFIELRTFEEMLQHSHFSEPKVFVCGIIFRNSLTLPKCFLTSLLTIFTSVFLSLFFGLNNSVVFFAKQKNTVPNLLIKHCERKLKKIYK